MVNVSYVVGFDKVEYGLESRVLVVVVDELGPVCGRNGDEDVVQEVVPWSFGSGFKDNNSAW